MEKHTTYANRVLLMPLAMVCRLHAVAPWCRGNAIYGSHSTCIGACWAESSGHLAAGVSSYTLKHGSRKPDQPACLFFGNYLCHWVVTVMPQLCATLEAACMLLFQAHNICAGDTHRAGEAMGIKLTEAHEKKRRCENTSSLGCRRRRRRLLVLQQTQCHM